MRFEFGGNPDAVDIAEPEAGRFVVTGEGSDVRVDLRLLEAVFRTREVDVVMGVDGDVRTVEARLYDGDPTAISLPDLDRAALAFGLSVLPDGESPVECEATTDRSTVVAEMVGPQYPGRAEVPAAPTTYDEYFERSSVGQSSSRRI